MKITRKQLRRIIAEEARLLSEDDHYPKAPGTNSTLYPSFPELEAQMTKLTKLLALKIMKEYKPVGKTFFEIQKIYEKGEGFAMPDNDAEVFRGMEYIQDILEGGISGFQDAKHLWRHIKAIYRNQT